MFIATLKDLDRRVHATDEDEYEILMSALLLRKLLLEGQTLVHLVNRNRRLKIVYRICGEGPYDRLVLSEPDLEMWSLQDGLDPDSIHIPSDPIIEVKEDKLLSRVIIVVKGHKYTVADVISHVAHISGAVHFGEPSNEKQEVLAAVDSHFFVGNVSLVVRSLAAVGRVVIKGLEPLRAQIEAEMSA
jgi:hypothetical protein